jgi:hypothetical protein
MDRSDCDLSDVLRNISVDLAQIVTCAARIRVQCASATPKSARSERRMASRRSAVDQLRQSHVSCVSWSECKSRPEDASGFAWNMQIPMFVLVWRTRGQTSITSFPSEKVSMADETS